MAKLASSALRRPRRIVIDTDGSSVTTDRIFVHRSEKSFVCVGLGVSAELIERAGQISDRGATKRFGRGAGYFGDPFLDRLDHLAKEYNSGEARVPAGNHGGGEWTSGGIVASAASVAANLFETDSASVAAGLATIASRFSGPTAFFGTLFIPTNRSLITTGAVPGNAGVSFQFDRGTGVLRLSRDDGTELFSSRYGSDGTFRDNNGNAFGRVVDGAVVLDPDALPGYASSSQSAARTGASAQARAQTDTDRNEPELCPDPTLENTNGRKERALLYQEQISGLPRGFDVQLNGVKFDGCRDSDGTMLEAKGPGYLKALRKPTKYPWLGMQGSMLKQASRQVAAAGDRPIEWHFAEEGVADFMRTLFAKRGFKISVIHTPSP